MAGGTWLTQNKVRPGAYINFESVAEPMMKVGSRGVAVVGLPLDFGPTGQVIELYSTDLLNGKSLAKIGYSAFDEESQVLREILRSAYKALVYRLDTGGVKASGLLQTEEDVTVCSFEAKYAGIAGNKIEVASVAAGELFDVITFYNGLQKDRQRVAKVGDLVDNDFVTFDGTAATALIASAGIPLTGGTNGTVTESSIYPTYLSAIDSYSWNTMAVMSITENTINTIKTYIANRRNAQGIKCQAVVNNSLGDAEGIISTKGQGYYRGSEQISAATFVATVAGLSAGANINESLTNRLIEGATAIINPLDNEEIIAALQAGYFVLSSRQSGKIKIEQDINSFTSFTLDKNKKFSKNRNLRVYDQVNNDTKAAWEETYEGNVDNDAQGRKDFKADMLNYLYTLEGMRAVQNINPDEDVLIEQGEDSDSVYARVGVEAVDSMEKLYMLVRVR